MAVVIGLRIAWCSLVRWVRKLFVGKTGENPDEPLQPFVCLIANMEVPEEGKEASFRLNNLYRPGQKVCVGYPRRKNFERLRVVGRFRGGGRLISSHLAGSKLHNWRAKVIYDPKVLWKLKQEGSFEWPSKEQASIAADWLNGACSRATKGYSDIPSEIEWVLDEAQWEQQRYRCDDPEGDRQ